LQALTGKVRISKVVTLQSDAFIKLSMNLSKNVLIILALITPAKLALASLSDKTA